MYTETQGATSSNHYIDTSVASRSHIAAVEIHEPLLAAIKTDRKQKPLIRSMVLAPRFQEIATQSQKDSADWVRKTYSNEYGNIANFVGDILEVRGKSSVDQMAELINLKDNLMSVIVEHPLADKGMIDTYKLNWDETGEVRVGSKTMSEILREGIENNFGQIPQFEIQRNIANLVFYNKLKAAHATNDCSEFVEFSPSPDMTQEALDRGYKGKDTVQIHKPNGEVVQYWLEPQQFAVYSALLERMGLIERNLNLTNQHDIMLASGKITPEQKAILMDFIDNNSVKSTIGHKLEPLNATETKKYFESDVNEFISEYFSLILDPDFNSNPEILKRLIEQIYLGLGVLQKRVKEFLDGNIENVINLGKMKLDDAISFINTNLGGMDNFTACGMGPNKARINGEFGNSGSLVNNEAFLKGKIIGVKTTDRPDLSEPCPHCHARWYIKENDASTWQSVCPNTQECGRVIPRC